MRFAWFRRTKNTQPPDIADATVLREYLQAIGAVPLDEPPQHEETAGHPGGEAMCQREAEADIVAGEPHADLQDTDRAEPGTGQPE
jgi:hypothetical protein